MVDPWTTAQRLLGRWEGPATGRPGVGRQVREYRLILRDQFILGTDETRWVPTPEEPDGPFHEDLCVLGLDRAAGQVVMRSFQGEGFVHEYRCAPIEGDGSRVVFEAAQVENGPPGMRARETLVFGGARRSGVDLRAGHAGRFVRAVHARGASPPGLIRPSGLNCRGGPRRTGHRPTEMSCHFQ